MTVDPLLVRAVGLLSSDGADPCLRDCGAAALGHAADSGMVLPPGGAVALLVWITTGGGAGRFWMLPESLGRISDPSVTAMALDLLRRDDLSGEVRAALFMVLSGDGHAPGLDDLTVAELVRTHEAAGEQVARLVAAVHESRGIDQEKLVEIRDGLRTSTIVDARLGAVTVGGLTEFSPEFWKQVVHDPSARVRSEAVRALGKEGPPPESVRIISERLHLPEPVLPVKAEMLSALGRLLRRLGS